MERTRFFFLNNWLRDENLASKYHRPFMISLQQRETIRNMVVWCGESWRWNLRWWRDCFMWEEYLTSKLMLLLSRVSLQCNEVYSWTYLHDSSGLYSVNSAHLSICERLENCQPCPIFYSIWNLHVPPKSKSLCGELCIIVYLQGKILLCKELHYKLSYARYVIHRRSQVTILYCHDR